MGEDRRQLGIVADYGGVGLGHLARCTAVLQAWVAGGGAASVFAPTALPRGWTRRIKAAGGVVIERPATPSDRPDIWLIDGYQFDRRVQRRFRENRPVAVVDDHGSIGSYDADVVIDPNLEADAHRYDGRVGPTQLLLGTRYALLRAEVSAAIPSEAPDRQRPPEHLLVSLGGEPTDVVRSTLEPVLDEARSWGLDVQLLRGVSDVSGPLRRTDLALSAAGGTCWELCAFGIPAVVVAVADNQKPIARALGRAGASIDAGDLGEVGAAPIVDALRLLKDDAPARRRCAEAGRRLIDGAGAKRVADVLRAVAASS